LNFTDEIERLQDEIARQYGFKIIFHDHRIFGLSQEAQEAEKREQR
jgi:Fe2+ or Zn2+ uptake regulation protein